MTEEKHHEKTEEHKAHHEKTESVENKTHDEKTKPTEHKVHEEKKNDEKKEVKKSVQKVKKDMVCVNATGLALSEKTSGAICRMIKYKPVDVAISDLEQVAKLKKVVPMRGEIPHRKGRGIMAGRFPQKHAKAFIVLLKSLKGNADNHDVDEPVIVEAYANKGFKPYGRFGRVQKKRSHITLKAISKKDFKKKRSEGKK